MNKDIKIHPETGEVLRRDIRPLEFNYKGEKIIMDMPGWYPNEGDDGIFTMEDMAVHDEALRILKTKYEKSMSQNDFQVTNAVLT